LIDNEKTHIFGADRKPESAIMKKFDVEICRNTSQTSTKKKTNRVWIKLVLRTAERCHQEKFCIDKLTVESNRAMEILTNFTLEEEARLEIQGRKQGNRGLGCQNRRNRQIITDPNPNMVKTKVDLRVGTERLTETKETTINGEASLIKKDDPAILRSKV
jgi:hypothetical protein